MTPTSVVSVVPIRGLAWVRSGLALSVIALLATLAPAAHPPSPADPLLRLVPPDTGICVVVQNLRQHSESFTNSPFAGWLRSSTLAQRVFPKGERAKLQSVEELLKTHLDLSLRDIRDEILGDAIVFAYQPGPPDQPSAESGVILIHPRKPELVQQLFEKLNTLQLRSGEVQSVKTVSYGGQSYHVRDNRTGKEYYRLHNGILAFSGQETAMRALIDRETAATPAPVPVGLHKLAAEKPLLAVWVNPRAFDTHLAVRATQSMDRKEAAFLEQFRKLWLACEGWAITVHPTAQLEIAVSASFQQDRIPAELRPFVLPDPGTSVFWSAIPDDTLFAIAGRTRPAEVMTALDSFLPAEGRKGLQVLVEQGLAPIIGRDRFTTTLQTIGPDWAFWAEVPKPDTAGFLPGWTVAVQLQDAEPKVAAAFEKAVELLVQLGRIAYNQSHADQIEMRQHQTDSRIVYYLTNEMRFLTGFRPAFARVGQTLLFASTPERILAYSPPTAAASTATTTPLLRLSIARIRAYLTEHQDALAQSLADWTGKPSQTVVAELQKFGVVLSAFESITVKRETTRTGAIGNVRVTATITGVKSLTK